MSQKYLLNIKIFTGGENLIFSCVTGRMRFTNALTEKIKYNKTKKLNIPRIPVTPRTFTHKTKDSSAVTAF